MTVKRWRQFNGLRAAFWTGVIPIAYFAGWIYSVAFVAVCSLYANVASDVAAWRSDVDPQLNRVEEKLDITLDRLDLLLDRPRTTLYFSPRESED